MSVVTVILLVCFQSLVLSLHLADPSGAKCEPVPRRIETCICQTQDGLVDMTTLSNDTETIYLFTNSPTGISDSEGVGLQLQSM